MVTVGQTLSIRGTEYYVANIKNCAGSGSKFFGKYVFTVIDRKTGEHFTAFGKTIAGNSKLTPANKPN